ncbi:RNA-binding protein 7 isoform X2 [Ricinus communis]|uniref:RNA-binding protein 7 isoform X2 n=1 Tax=Ricinus communis TaxID=3988 RepID=UPI000772407E|nr:RNA-binding protein 7 isoform X2 [Ricinus communis]|eukprot:XP_015577443.1 RNA-binding protein 7 isoform X2 [Ricinus communis]
MHGSSTSCTVYIGNLDERVSERVLYDILIQAGRVVELYIPRDKETDKSKGYAFAEYESEQIADYAVKLFSGLVILHNRTLKFAISGQDKALQNVSSGAMHASNSSNKPRPYPMPMNNVDNTNQSMRLSASCRISAYPYNHSQGASILLLMRRKGFTRDNMTADLLSCYCAVMIEEV